MLLSAKPIYSSPRPYNSIPQALLFSPVSQCNLNCTHCISRPTREKLRFASERVWNAVVEVTRGEKFVHLATDYSGDILFDERRYPGTLARLIALDARFRIDTNATCLDDDIIDLLFRSRLHEINFSIDSMDPDVYRSIRRGSLPLSDVLAKVAHFMSRKAIAGKEIHTVLSFVLMRSNATTIKPALAFARQHRIDHVNVVPLLAFTDDMVEEVFVWDEAAYAALHEELSAEAARLGVALAMQGPVEHWREDDIHAPCEVPWATATITANGDVMACCMPGTVVGNLNVQTLDEIWNGAEFSAFRSRVNTPNPPRSCRSCGMPRVANTETPMHLSEARHGLRRPKTLLPHPGNQQTQDKRMKLPTLLTVCAGFGIMVMPLESKGKEPDFKPPGTEELAAVEQANAKLDGVYKRLMGKLDAEGQKALKEAERSWIKWRDAEAMLMARAGGAVGGSAMRVDFATAQKKLIDQRIDVLSGYLKQAASD